jgi:hypothetical protein
MTTLDAASDRVSPRTPALPVWIRLAGLAIAGLAAGVAAAVMLGGTALLRRAEPRERPPVRMALGPVQVVAPAALVRGTPAAGRLDLRLPLTAVPGAAEMRLAVTLMPAADTPAPETRVSSLYPRFFTAEVASGPAGLIRRGLRAGSPYSGEYVLFAVPDGRRFTARCEAAGQDGAPPQCLAEFRRRGIDIQLRFTPPDAAAWEAMVSDALPRIEAMLR